MNSPLLHNNENGYFSTDEFAVALYENSLAAPFPVDNNINVYCGEKLSIADMKEIEGGNSD